MRNLSEEEISEGLAEFGEPEEGDVAVETTVSELASLGVGTSCGGHGNKTFEALREHGYGECLCRGWYNAEEKWVNGMFAIRILRDSDAYEIEDIANTADGSLRFEGESKWEGFMIYEIE